MSTIHLLLVDDQVLFVESLGRVLQSISSNVVVDAIALTGEEAIAAAERFRPNVILMDVRMAGMNGVEATGIIRERLPETQVIILTTYDDDEYVHAALRAGAIGYLLKDIPPHQLVTAIGAVSNGAFLISPSIAQRLVRVARERRHDPAPIHPTQYPVPHWLTELSKREKEVLYCIANGMNNQQIAGALFIAEQTVKNHVSTIYSKIGQNDRFRVIALIKEALESGYLLPPQ